MKQRAFTLIELMVVVSIISLLASIMLAAFSAAHDKADNAYRIRTIEEYVKALALYKEGHQSYPPWVGTVCLSSPFSPGTGCIAPGNDLDTFIKLQPPFAPITKFGITLYGPVYQCAATPCLSVTLSWSLHHIQDKSSCMLQGSATSTAVTVGLPDATECTATFN
ncbi:MAG: type II secretion system protein [Minisyncoccota bacterium]